jgi:hypothetical protein
VKQGKDPILEASNQKADNTKAQARARTLRQVADEYTQTDKFRKSMSERHAKQWKSQVEKHLYLHFDNGNALVADIASKHCVQSLKAVWSSNPKTAKNLRERLEKIIGYAIWKGYRNGPNPAVWADNAAEGRQSSGAAVREGCRLFGVAARHARCTGRCVLFGVLILTACRSGEARKATRGGGARQ